MALQCNDTIILVNTVRTTASVMKHDWDLHFRPCSKCCLEADAMLQTIMLMLHHVSTRLLDGNYTTLYMLTLNTKQSPAG